VQVSITDRTSSRVKSSASWSPTVGLMWVLNAISYLRAESRSLEYTYCERKPFERSATVELAAVAVSFSKSLGYAPLCRIGHVIRAGALRLQCHRRIISETDAELLPQETLSVWLTPPSPAAMSSSPVRWLMLREMRAQAC
jgi:hypothetical protein